MSIVMIDDPGSVECASCDANWSIPLIAEGHAKRALRSMGFAFIWFDDGAICINHCPHCEMPVLDREVRPWLISPLFP